MPAVSSRSTLYTAVGRLGVPTDDLAGEYSAMVFSGSESASMEEAAALFVSAEKHLTGNEDVDAALSIASEARSLFQKAGNKEREAEAIRLGVFAKLAKVDVMRYSTTASDKAYADSLLKEVDLEVRKELDAFQTAGSRKGEACMLLSLVDIELDRRPILDHDEALQACTTAKEIFHDIGDKRFEVQASIAMVTLLAAKPGSEAKMLPIAKTAVTLARQHGDRLTEAKALHTLALVNVAKENWKDAFRRAEEALAIYEALLLWKWEALIRTELAEWSLLLENPEQALPHAQAARKLFRDYNYGKGWQAVALDVIVRVLMAQDQKQQGLALAAEGTAELDNRADKRTMALGYDALTHAHLLAGSKDGTNFCTSDAQRAAERALALTREFADTRWEACMLFNLAQTLLRLGQSSEGIKLAEEAGDKLAELGDFGGQAITMQVRADAYIAEDQIEKAIEVTEKAAALFQKGGDLRREAGSRLTTGILYAYSENLEKAFEYGTQAQHLAEQATDKRTEAAAWNLVSQVHAAAGNGTDALQAAKKMRVRYAQAMNQRWQAISLYMIAYLSDAEGKLDAAVRAAEEAVTCARRVEDNELLIEMLILASRANFAMTSKVGLAAKASRPSIAARSTSQRHVFQPSKAVDAHEPFLGRALVCAQEAVELARETGAASERLGGSLYCLALVNLLIRKFKAGLAEAEEAVNVFRGNGDDLMQAASLLLVAHACKALSKSADSQAAASSAVELFEKLGDEAGAAEGRKILGKAEDTEASAALRALPGVAGSASQTVPAKTGLSMEETTAAVLKLVEEVVGGDEDIVADEPLMDIGVDSLAAVDFRNQIVKRFDLPVSSSLIFDYPSTRSVAEHLVELSLEG
mmetsp:Transcript_63391/g.151295  ORF Transcript_63391/g.151295 Transcript_63391/m.151295 type:complete len:869 (+) Transcript_63391:111-2717(+)